MNVTKLNPVCYQHMLGLFYLYRSYQMCGTSCKQREKCIAFSFKGSTTDPITQKDIRRVASTE